MVIDDAKDAVPTAKAMAAGGVDVMEITLRTAAGLDAIREVAQNCAAGNFEKITKLCAEAREIALGYEVGHIGINCKD